MCFKYSVNSVMIVNVVKAYFVKFDCRYYCVIPYCVLYVCPTFYILVMVKTD